MSWRDNLRRGSYRGVAFDALRSGESGRQRGEHHVYPLRDQGWVEQLGLDDDRISIEAVLIGDDYQTRLEDLRAALKAKGTGELIHPWRGPLTVTVDPSAAWNIEETIDRGRMARISMTFLIAPATGVYPTAEQGVQGAVAAAADRANDSAVLLFGAEINLTGAAAILDDVEAAFDDAFEVFDGARSLIRQGASLQSRAVSIVFGAVARGQSVVRDFLSVGDAVGALGGLFDATAALFGRREQQNAVTTAPGLRPAAASTVSASVALTPAEAGETATALKLTLSRLDAQSSVTPGFPVSGPGLGQTWDEASAATAAWIRATDPALADVRNAETAVGALTFVPADTRRIANRAMITGAIETALVSELSRAVVAAEYDSHQAAIAAMKDLDGRIETCIRRVADSAPGEHTSPVRDNHIGALTALRRTARTAVLKNAADLTPIITRDLGERLPTLAAIWRLTGTIGAEAELIARNDVSHPLWAPSALSYREGADV